MDDSLDFSAEEFGQLLEQTALLIQKQYATLADQKGFNNYPQQAVEQWFDEPLPLKATAWQQVLADVQTKVLEPATGNFGPHMYAYVMAGGNQVSSVADFIASTINQNAAKWHLAPSMTEIEKRVVKWTAQMLNFTPDAGGAMVTGGSAANLAGLTVARNIYFRKHDINRRGLFGHKPFTIYCSDQTHNSVDKSISLLGIGTDQLRRTTALADFTIDIEALRKQIDSDIEDGFKPFCLIGNAGTVNTGAIDDLVAMSAVAKDYDMWFHVDGSYGGLASALPHLRPVYAGMELADSIAVDFHKWLYQPYEIGCVLVREWSLLREAYFKQADYLDTSLESKSPRLEFNEHYFQLSRNAKAFKVWMSLKVYGFDKIRDMIQKDIDLTHYLADKIEESSDFELKSKSHLAITCFRYIGKLQDETAIADLNQRLIPALEADGRVFITGTKLNQQFVIRACLINHRKTKETVAHLLDVIREVAGRLA